MGGGRRANKVRQASPLESHPVFLQPLPYPRITGERDVADVSLRPRPEGDHFPDIKKMVLHRMARGGTGGFGLLNLLEEVLPLRIAKIDLEVAGYQNSPLLAEIEHQCEIGMGTDFFFGDGVAQALALGRVDDDFPVAMTGAVFVKARSLPVVAIKSLWSLPGR